LISFKQILKREGITLYAILVGSKGGSPLLDKNGKIVIKNGKVVTTTVDEYLGKVAQDTGGDYIVANYGIDDVKELVNKIKQRHKEVFYSKKDLKVVDKVELFYYPLILSIILLFFAMVSIPDSFENIKIDFSFLKRGKK